MKILTGYLKGRPIRLAPNENLRPTSDLVRKSIFDTLQGVLEGKRALDLFCGTGALGFEALSSGASEVVWVDSERAQAEAVEKTIVDLVLQDLGRVIQSDVFRTIESLSRQGESFDVIFLDPPYHKGMGMKAVKLICEANILSPAAILVLETHKTEDPPQVFGNLKTVKMKKHGDTKVTFYRVV